MANRPELKIRLLLTPLLKRWEDWLYGLIQPDHIPEPKAAPRFSVEILITLLGIVAWLVFLLNYERISPVASLDLRYSRSDIARLAQAHVAKQGWNLSGYKQVITFENDWAGQTYLERTLGVAQLTELVSVEHIPIWSWHVRWFIPQRQQEYHVHLLPTGQIVGMTRILAEESGNTSLDEKQAFPLAQRALTSHVQDSTQWQLYDTISEKLPHRTDHTFTWVRQDLDTGAGDLRTTITVQGNQVGRVQTWLRVPEEFSRAFGNRRSQARLLDDIATGLGNAFVIGAAVVVLWGTLSGLRIGWSPILLGLVAGLVEILNALNYLPLIDAYYDTAISYQSYVIAQLSAYADRAIATTVYVTFLAIASRWIVRAVWPRQHKLRPNPKAPWGHVARSSWRGVMLGGLMGAFLVIFYAAAQAMGTWSPVRTPNLNLLATPLPVMAAIHVGLLPALREEFQYRAIGMGLVTKLSQGRNWLALVITSLLWGFAHASYVTEPIGLRGIELTLSALLLSGLFFLLFDLTTSIVAHYTYNAALTAAILVRSSQPSFILTGLVAILLGLAPILLALIFRARRRNQPHSPLKITQGKPDELCLASNLIGEPLSTTNADTIFCLWAPCESLVGFLVSRIRETADQEPYAEITHIYVAPSARRRYGGTQLYQSAQACLRGQGIALVQVGVPHRHAGLTTFWILQGFRPKTHLWSRRLDRS